MDSKLLIKSTKNKTLRLYPTDIIRKHYGKTLKKLSKGFNRLTISLEQKLKMELEKEINNKG